MYWRSTCHRHRPRCPLSAAVFSPSLQQLLFSSNPTTVLQETFSNPQTGAEEFWCKGWLNSYLQVQTLMYSSAVIVVAVNLVFRRLLKPVVRFEHEWYAAEQS